MNCNAFFYLQKENKNNNSSETSYRRKYDMICEACGIESRWSFHIIQLYLKKKIQTTTKNKI